MKFFEAAGIYAALKVQRDAIRRSDPELEVELEGARIRAAKTAAPDRAALAWKIVQGFEGWSPEADTLIVQSAALGWLGPLPKRLRALAAECGGPGAAFLHGAADDAERLESAPTRPDGLGFFEDEPRR